ncbi:hypothetical protein AgCh_021704 [Apium graveolens]
MAPLDGSNEKESLRTELSDIGRSLRSTFGHLSSSFRNNISLSSLDYNGEDHQSQQCAEIARLSTFKSSRSSSFDEDDQNTPDVKMMQVVDATKLGALERHMFIEKLVKHAEHDNLQLLQKIKKRIDKVGVRLPTVEVKYTNMHVEAECEVVHGKPLPTLWNSLQNMISDIAKLPGSKPKTAKINIIDDISGIIKPGRITLLLGPPGCGKTSFLKALSGNLDKSLKMTGNISYNGYNLKDIIPQKTSAYVSQNDLHISEMTVRETLNFSACCQGIGSRAEIMDEVGRKEKEAGIFPDPDIDIFMKAISIEGQKETLQTNYIVKILGLDTCADVLVGNAMKRGISGGEKKRLTTGEMIVGPTRAFFMDEISSGLDSSTTYQIISCLQQLAHITDATVLVSLLQPAPETFDIFDDVILMAEGKIVYHGSRSHILEFFEGCGFKCPERKGVADFLQEVISRKDQAQYWNQTEHAHSYVSVRTFYEKFKQSPFGKKLDEEISEKILMSKSHDNSISFSVYSLSKWTLFKACMSREFLLMRRNSFIYIFKSAQLIIIAAVTMTVFLRSRMNVDALDADKYLGALFYSLVIILVDGFPEVSMTVARLAVFYKQRELCFYPAWGYAISAAILKIPLSLLESVIWVFLTYYVIGYSPEPGRFFRHLILLFSVHWTSISMFRFIASVLQTVVASTTTASLSILVVLLFGGFIIPKSSMPLWLEWAFWLSPLSYGEIGLAINEFLAPRWQKLGSTDVPIGITTLESRSLNFDGHFFWISISVLSGFILFFNIGFIFALSFLNPPGSRAIVSSVKLSQIQRSEEFSNTDFHVEEKCSNRGKAVLPFEPTSLVFQDVQYYVDAPSEMRERGFSQKKLQILHDITGALRPGVLTALMGVTGAGKTTLLDVLAGRKTCGTIKGDIKVGGYPKIQETFARISGYCEQTDIHSPQQKFVKDVLQTVELDGLKDALVGIPGVSGLSTEQRKRLTIAVELVANPSILFMDEPTTGLDARAAAIVMRAVKNVADTGRTIVCTIHQPSTDIFEAFDERIPGVASISKNYNPATWMLEVTSKTAEAELGLDFAQVYQSSALHERNRELVKSLSIPPPVFWDQGKKIATIFCGINNSSSVIPYVTTERNVLYRERFAGMYAPWAYGLAQQIPKWWKWLYYLMPTSWTLNGMLSSQYGDIEKEIIVFGETKAVSAFLRDYFGFHRDRLPLVGAMLILYPVLFASIFAYAIGRFNFQRR